MAERSASSDGLETEWQFDAPNLDAVAAWLLEQPPSAALTFALAKDAVQTDVYWDTEDWVVHRAGFGLRVRRKGDGAEATLKSFGDASGDGPRIRREINQPLESPDTPLADAIGAVSDRIRLMAGSHPLRRLFEVTTHRRAYKAESQGRAVAEVAVDNTSIVAGGSVRLLKRIEIEATAAGWESLLPSFVAAMVEDLELRPAEASKFGCGLELAELNPKGWLQIGPRTIDPEAGASAYALATCRRFFATMLQHEPGARLGDDPEELHDMRVALRRLRAALSLFRDALPEGFEALKDDLRWLGRSLGEVRDLDVQIAAFEAARRESAWLESNALGELLQVLHTSHAAARSQLIEAINGDRYATLLANVKGLLAEPAAPISEEPIRDFIAPLIRKRYRKFRDDARELGLDSENAAYHAVRVRGKRMRYAIEFVRPIYGRPAERMAEAASVMQDVLGEHQDAAVTIEWLRRLVKVDGRSLAPQTLMFMGQMLAQQQQNMAQLRTEWPDAFKELRQRWRAMSRALDAKPDLDDADGQPQDETAEPVEQGPALQPMPPLVVAPPAESPPRWPRSFFSFIGRRRLET